MRRSQHLLGLLFLCTLAWAQQTSTPPAFEAADVHVSAAGGTESGGFLPNGRLEFRSTTLLRLIALAYNVSADRVTGGPNWLDTERFDVTAKATSSASEPALRAMLRRLLEERFKLTAQQQEKDLPVQALILAKAGVARESPKPGDPDCKLTTEETARVYTCQNVTAASLAERLPLAARAYFPSPVVDRTGLKGTYDFQLRWLPRAQLDSPTNPLSLFVSLEKQLGIRVESQTAPLNVLTVVSVNRTPTENASDVTAKLGPAPTEFEVANIKRSRPGEEPNADVNNGRLDAKALSLKELIGFAYDVEEDWIRGGEKWLETERFDILAKTAPTASVDTLRTMLQSLLAERFKLKVHKEQQPVSVYALTGSKVKATESQADTRSTCKSTAQDGARLYTCQNTTMAQLAEKLRSVAAAYLEHPVVDLTGLKAGYDFSLSWAPRARILGGERPASDAPAGAAVPTATDRPVGLTIFESVERQLGLKLAQQKHPMPVIVVDHVDRTPTEN